MKLPSISQTLRDAAGTARRFPLVLLTAFTATGAGLALIEAEESDGLLFLFNVVYACLPAMPLLFAIAAAAEKAGMSRGKSLLLQLAALAAAAVYGATLPGNIPGAPGTHGARLALLVAGAVLAASVLPWLNRGEVNGFWQYNRRLILRGLTAGFFAGVLFAGLAIAMAALDNLFGIDIPEKRYPQLWVLLLGCFAVWFFLAGVPADLRALEGDDSYPKGFKVFAQYIVLPLALLYLVILYAYIGRIIIVWEWPRGWVTGLVLGFAATGAFTLLLLHPLRELAGNVWIRNALRRYHLALIPPAAMLFLAVWRRVSEYGMTESRYLALLLGVWCCVMIVYFLAFRGRSIKAMPLVLCALALLASFGPWGAFSVSERSQTARLETLLADNGMLAGGRVVKAARAVSGGDAREISSTLSYLRDMHGYEGIQTWFAENLRRDGARDGEFRDAAEVARLLGVEYTSGWAEAEQEHVTFEAAGNEAISAAGYDGMLPERYFSNASGELKAGGAGLSLRSSADLSGLTIYVMSGDVPADSAAVDMLAPARRINASYALKNPRAVPPDSMAVEASCPSAAFKIFITRLSLRREEGRISITGYRAGVLFRGIADTTAPSR